jgi:hypothetical protein
MRSPYASGNGPSHRSRLTAATLLLLAEYRQGDCPNFLSSTDRHKSSGTTPATDPLPQGAEALLSAEQREGTVLISAGLDRPAARTSHPPEPGPRLAPRLLESSCACEAWAATLGS